jgi:pSer/pThr/pTyr-binding forkhead associated (FHA) protein
MSQPTDIAPVTPEEIIQLILEEMRTEVAPSFYSNWVRSVYHVYLYTDDLERLRPILPRVREEGVRALNEELSKLNRSAQPRLRVPLLTDDRRAKRYEATGEWVIEFHENTDEDAHENPLVIQSSFGQPADAEDRAGLMTERILKRRADGQTSSTTTNVITDTARSAGALDTGKADGIVLATLEYEDDSGPHVYQVTKELIKIGRGAADRWVDLKVTAKKDVSREHFQIRRAPNGQFYIKDLSLLGTTVNGKRIPSSVDRKSGEEVDRNVEVPLPAKAKIGLAGVLIMEFRAAR